MLEMAFKIQAQIIDFWKFYVPATMALLGWIFARRQPWPWSQRLAVAITYVGFVVLNLYGLAGSYKLLAVLVAELRASGEAQDMTAAAFEAVLERLSFGADWWIVVAFHVIVDLIVLYFILVRSGKKQTG